MPEFVRYKIAGNILKNYSKLINDDIALDLLKYGEKLLNKDYLHHSSNVSTYLMDKENTQVDAEIRKSNAKFLHEKLDDLEIIHLYDANKVPFFVPIFINDRNKLRSAMFQNKIFTPVHWPYESNRLNGNKKNKIYDIELSLICDQRYGIDDMKRMIDIIEEWKEYENRNS